MLQHFQVSSDILNCHCDYSIVIILYRSKGKIKGPGVAIKLSSHQKAPSGIRNFSEHKQQN